MESRDKEVIKRRYVRLERNLEATKLLSYLYQENVLSEEDMETVKSEGTTNAKAYELLEILKRRKGGLKMLIKALLVTEVQAFLAYELLESVSWSEEEVENLKREVEGKIDPLEAMELKMAALQQKYNALALQQSKEKEDFEKRIDIQTHSFKFDHCTPRIPILTITDLVVIVFEFIYSHLLSQCRLFNMERRDKEVIRRRYVRLEQNLEATKLLSYLYQENVLSEEDMETVKSKATTKAKADKLLKILMRRKDGLKMLIKALLVAKVQAFLAYELLEIVSWSEEEFENLKHEIEGNIDPLAAIELNMAALQQKYNALVLQQSKEKEYYEKQIKIEELNEKLIDIIQTRSFKFDHFPPQIPSIPTLRDLNFQIYNS